MGGLLRLAGGSLRRTGPHRRPVRDRDWAVVGASSGDMLARGFQQVGKDFPIFLHPQTREEYALARGGSIEADLAARDLSINAMALDEDGTLADPFGGQTDLKARVLRHVPGFAQDPIRILRTARFAAQLDGFTIAPETLALMTGVTAAGALDAVTRERVWLELDKALGCDRPIRAAHTAAAAITARDLIKAGHSTGPSLGEVLFQKRAEAIRKAFPCVETS